MSTYEQVLVYFFSRVWASVVNLSSNILFLSLHHQLLNPQLCYCHPPFFFFFFFYINIAFILLNFFSFYFNKVQKIVTLIKRCGRCLRTPHTHFSPDLLDLNVCRIWINLGWLNPNKACCHVTNTETHQYIVAPHLIHIIWNFLFLLLLLKIKRVTHSFHLFCWFNVLKANKISIKWNLHNISFVMYSFHDVGQSITLD